MVKFLSFIALTLKDFLPLETSRILDKTYKLGNKIGISMV